MKVKALTSFSSLNLSMIEGEVGEVTDKSLLDDLLNAGYVALISEESKEKPAKKAVKKSESK